MWGGGGAGEGGGVQVAQETIVSAWQGRYDAK